MIVYLTPSGTLDEGDTIAVADTSGNFTTGQNAEHKATLAQVAAVLARGSYLVGATQKVNAVTASGATLTLPAPSTATFHSVTLGHDVTITLPAATAGQVMYVELVQDGSGNHTVAWTTAKWAAGSAPTITATAAAIDAVMFICLDGTNWLGRVIGQAYA